MDRQPTLASEGLVLRPLEVTDRAALFEAASDPLIWTQHPAQDRWQPRPFDAFFDAAMASKGALLIQDGEGLVIGTSRYYDADGARSVAIGYTFLRCSHWGGGANAQVKALMLDHAFESVEEVHFHVGRDNLRSQRALAKLGVEVMSSPAIDPRFPPETYRLFRLSRTWWREKKGLSKRKSIARDRFFSGRLLGQAR